MKIGLKIILGYSIVIIIMIGIEYFGISYFVKKSLGDSIGQTSQTLADLTMQRVDRDINSHLKDLEEFSKIITPEKVLMESNEEFSKTANPEEYILEKDKEWVEVPKEEKTEFMKSIIDNGLSSKIRNEFEMKDYYQSEFGFPIWSEVFVTNKFGANIAQSDKTTDYNQADEIWWQIAKNNGNYVGDVNYDESSDAYSLDMSIRIDDSDGNFLGVIKGILNINDVIDLIKTSELEDKNAFGKERVSTKFELFTSDGKSVYSENQEKILQTGISLSQVEIAKNIAQAGKKYFIVNYGQEKKMYIFSESIGYGDFKGLGWYLLVTRDADLVLDPVRKLQNSVSLIALATIPFMLLLSYFISSLIVRPLTKLIEGTEIIKKGNFNYKVGTNARDEIGQFSRSFDEMTDRIKDFYTVLEKKVENKTTELTKAMKELEKKNIDFQNSEKAMFNILQDVEENRKQIEEEKIKYEAERDRGTGILRYLHSISEGIIAMDNKGLLVFVNLTAAKMVLRDEGSPLIGKKYQDVFKFVRGKDKKASTLDPLSKVLESSKAYVLPSNSYLLVGSRVLPVSGSFAPILKDDKSLGVVSVFQDITERYRLEMEKDNFISVAAHQLRTPLSGIRWMLESLLDGEAGELPKEAKETLLQIFENNQRLNTLVNDLLDVSRINTGKNIEKASIIDPIEVFEKALEALSGNAKQRGVSVRFIKSEQVKSQINVAPTRFFQALENLISNAIKYTQKGGYVEAKIESSEKKIIFSIKDTGIGIPEKEKERIFQKFFRASNAIIKENEGSGLGLNVVKSFVEECGGKIWFESKEGEGTTFFIEVPDAS